MIEQSPPLAEEPVIPIPDEEQETNLSIGRWLAFADRVLARKRLDQKTG